MSNDIVTIDQMIQMIASGSFGLFVEIFAIDFFV